MTMPMLPAERPIRLASTLTGLFLVAAVASLACVAWLLVGAMGTGAADDAVADLPGTSLGLRRDTVHWVVFGLTAFGGLLALAGVAVHRAVLEHGTQRRVVRAAEALEIMLAEKDALLAEVYHRVNNNMQVVVNLLQMEGARLPEGATRQRLDALARRLALIGQIHQRIYASDSVARVDVAAHVRRHCAGLAEEQPRATLSIDAEPLYCDLDTALPIALIAHELASNALVHAGDDSRVAVSLRRVGENVVLRVEDPGAGPDPTTVPGIGLILVDLMAEQLGATVASRRQAGYRVEVALAGSMFPR
jgi:two-component sensor histidine kinase